MTDTYRANAVSETKSLTWWDKLLGRKPPVIEVPPEPAVYYNPVQDAKAALNKLAESRFTFLTPNLYELEYYLPLKSGVSGLHVSYGRNSGVYLVCKDSKGRWDTDAQGRGWWTPEVVEEIVDVLPDLEEGFRKAQAKLLHQREETAQAKRLEKEQEALKWKNATLKISGLMEKKE